MKAYLKSEWSVPLDFAREVSVLLKYEVSHGWDMSSWRCGGVRHTKHINSPHRCLMRQLSRQMERAWSMIYLCIIDFKHRPNVFNQLCGWAVGFEVTMRSLARFQTVSGGIDLDPALLLLLDWGQQASQAAAQVQGLQLDWDQSNGQVKGLPSPYHACPCPLDQ